ncbi:MAG: hypothetical protein IPJ03_16500 [Ignavibacteriales bacterium]|nr:hypothetical protein [Ignavibacteriales bacterium]
MLLDYIRIFKFDGSSLTDQSLLNQDDSTTLPLNLDTDDYLYIGQRFPFTNLFFQMDTVNGATGSISVDYWDGTQWRAGVDVLDGTKSSTIPLAKSGNLSWGINQDYNWQIVNDTTDSSAPSGLAGVYLYDTYWTRLSVNSSVSGSCDAKEIGYAFTTSSQLKSVDIEIDGYLNSFENGKTDWIPEIMTASKQMVTDLKRLGLVVHQGQIIELDDVWLPATYKTLSLIYFNLGPSYNDKRAAVEKMYKDALNIRRYTFDTNADGKLEKREIAGQVRRLVR